MQHGYEEIGLLFDKFIDPILLLEEYTFIDCNQAALRLMKCTDKKQLAGVRLLDVSPERQPDGRLSREQATRNIETARREGSNRFEWVHVDFQGHEICVDVSLAAMPDERRPIMLTVWRDASECRRAKELVERSEEKYLDIFENAIDGMFHSSTTGDLINVNRALAQMYGYDSPGNMIASIVDPGHQVYVRQRDRLDLLRLVRTQGAAENFEAQHRRRDGRNIWVSVNARAVRSAEGETLYYKGTVRNITERKQKEEQLHAAHEQVLSIIESLPDATFAVNNEKKVIAWNKAMEQMTGVEKRSILGKGDFSYSVPFYGRPRPMLIDLVFGDNSDFKDEFKFVCREGDKLLAEAYVPDVYNGKGAYLLGTASPLVDASGRVTGAIESIRPITEIKRIEKELQESEERYRVAIENSPDAIAMVKDGRYLYVNAKFMKIFGFENAGEVRNQPLGTLVDPNDLPALADLCDTSKPTRDAARQYTFRGVRKDGRTVFVEASIAATTYLGEPVSLAYFQDVTPQRTAEKALVEAENRYRGLFQNLPDGFVLVDGKRRIIEANAALQAMVGYRRDELLNLSLMDLTPDKWRSLDDFTWRQVSTKGFSDIYEKEYIRKDGTVFPVEVRAHLLTDENGNPAGMWGIIRDITRRKLWEERLRETEERYRKVVHLSPIGIFIHVGGRVQFTNPAFALMIGAKSTEELLGTSARSFVHKNYQDLVVKRVDNATAEGSEPPLLEQKWVRLDGTVINVEARAFPFNYEGRDGIMVVAEDITQRKRAEQALKNREKELENKSVNLAETNTALRVLLRQREEDKKSLESAIAANIKELVFPYIEKLRSGILTEKQMMYVNMIESNLNDVISPFLQKINTVFERLTPMEVQVANMIRGGKTSKEIAEVLNISKGTVDGYRNSIRDKLGLRNRSVNLQTYLLSI